MDDKIFEKRLRSMKDSYEKMPSTTNAVEIMDKINAAEKNTTKRTFHLPYVASFIGVLLLAGILMTQLIPQQNDNSSAERQVSALIIEEKTSQLEEFYQHKLDELKNELGFEKVEEYTFVSEAKVLVETFKNSSPAIYATEKNLDIQYEETKNAIERKLMTPKQEIAMLLTAKQKQEVTTDEEVASILAKQEELLPLFQEKWSYYYEMYKDQLSEQNSDMLTAFIGYKEFQGKDVSLFAEALAGNGYRLSGDDGQEVVINYRSRDNYEHYAGVDRLPGLSNAMRHYLDIKAMPFMETGSDVTESLDYISACIAELEMFIEENKGFIKNYDLYGLYVYYFNNYVNNHMPTLPLFKDEILRPEVKHSYEAFFKAHPETQSADVIKRYYEMLKENDFKRIYETPAVPQLIEGIVPESVKPNQNVNRIEGESLIITDELIGIYSKYKEQQNDSLLLGLRPFDVMRIYMYASDQGDWETTYSLYYKSEETLLPSLEMYRSERNTPTQFIKLNESFQYAEERNQSEYLVVNLYLGEDIMSFRLQKGNDVWKVSYMPMQ